MELIGKIENKFIDEDKNMFVQFKMQDYNSKKRAEELDKTKYYKLEIKEVKSKRSIEQNKLLWKIIKDTTEEIRKDDPDYYEMNLYIDLLKETNCKYEYLIVPNDECIDRLRQTFRAVEFIKMHNVDGKPCKMIKIYLGSSKFSVKEMNLLIEKAKYYASQFNLYYDDQYYE